MLDFVTLTASNFADFEEAILLSEQVFPEKIRESSEGYLDALSRGPSIAIVAIYNGVYTGNALGLSPDIEQRALLKLGKVRCSFDNFIYLSSIVTLPAFQGKGFGKELLIAFLDRARKARFKTVGGHFRCNGSLKIFKDMGGKEIGVFKNWFDTGERYIYCEVDLA